MGNTPAKQKRHEIDVSRIKSFQETLHLRVKVMDDKIGKEPS
jgi:hypothetical protein